MTIIACLKTTSSYIKSDVSNVMKIEYEYSHPERHMPSNFGNLSMWCKATEDDKRNYKNMVGVKLSNMSVPSDLISCSDTCLNNRCYYKPIIFD